MIKFSEDSGADNQEMNNHRLKTLIDEVATSVGGETGAWRFTVDGVVMFCITDEAHDRMRIISPIAAAEELDHAILTECLAANFDRALDARYCIHDGTVWGAYIHPLSPTSDEQILSAINQVAQVSRNFGKSFSSSPLVFGS